VKALTTAIWTVSIATCALLLSVPAVAGSNPDPKQLVLQLSDVPSGFGREFGIYRSNADVARTRNEPTSKLIKLGRMRGYVAHYKKHVSITPHLKGPYEIEADVGVYRAAAGAHASFVEFLERIHHIRRAVGTPLGGESGLSTYTYTRNGVLRRPFLVYWRTGRLVGEVIAEGVAGGIDAQTVIDLAKRQQARMRRAVQ
jgi:hypothetical protein